jgi:cysteine dioxygenase
MTKINNLKQLISDLDKCENGDIKGFEKILSHLDLSKNKIAEIEKKCVWNANFYTRNLVKRSDKYELIFLCWESGQVSPIHDHTGQSCWVKILQGDCEEKLYLLDDKNNKLKLIKTSRLGAEEQSYIHDDIALHSLGNIGKNKMIGIHLYLNPIDTCFVYDIDGEEKKLIQTKYTSVLDQID